MHHQAKIVAVLTAKPGKTAELRELLTGMSPHCRAEPGNIRWDIWHDPSEPARFVLDELYRDVAAVSAHRETAHFQAYLAAIPHLAERSALVVHPVDVE